MSVNLFTHTHPEILEISEKSVFAPATVKVKLFHFVLVDIMSQTTLALPWVLANRKRKGGEQYRKRLRVRDKSLPGSMYRTNNFAVCLYGALPVSSLTDFLSESKVGKDRSAC